MIEYLGIAYAVGKDIYNFIKKTSTLQIEDKLVNNQWLAESGFQENAETLGYILRWSKPDKIEERRLKGYDIFYEIDQKNSKAYRLIDKSASVLMAKLEKK